MAFFTNFKKSAEELKSVKCIVTIGLLLAVGVVLDGFGTIRIGDAIKINFTFLPLAMIGILFGPVCGFLGGMLVDIIGYLVNPIGAFIPWLVLIQGLEGLIYGMILYNLKAEKTWQTFLRIIVSRFIVCALCNLTLNTWALYSMGFIKGDSFGVLFVARIITNLITFALGSAMMTVLCIPLKLAYNRIFRKNTGAKEAQ
ncbi:MAG: folate family ECF transporter S component [Oscillospiraceae bacterium]|nr:folate family ECF transporter S component [Oscillospiraceae bacterium]